jgi:hypothetical protein
MQTFERILLSSIISIYINVNERMFVHKTPPLLDKVESWNLADL